MKIVRTVIPVIMIVMLSTIVSDVLAQCPMCRSAVESAMQNEGNKTGAGLNDGIVYLLSIPYLAVIVTGGIWYYHRKRSNR